MKNSMHLYYRHRLFLIVFAFFGSSLSAVSSTEPVLSQPSGDSPDAWEVYLKPYFWSISIDATSTVNGLSGSVSLSNKDVVDYLDFGIMGRLEAWKGPWGFYFDGLFMNLGADGSFKGARNVVNFAMDADVRLGMADFGLAYRIFENRFGSDNEQKLTFEPYGGLRYAYVRQRINLNVNIAGVGSAGRTIGTSEDWVEPFVGGRVIWDLNDTLGVYAMGDAGGFGIGSASDLLYQFSVGLDYKLSETTSFNAGYRVVDLDYSRGSGSEEFGIDMRAKGPFFGMTIGF